MGQCKDCKRWEFPANAGPLYGECSMAGDSGSMFTASPLCRPGEGAYGAILITQPTFGCIQFTPSTPEGDVGT